MLVGQAVDRPQHIAVVEQPISIRSLAVIQLGRCDAMAAIVQGQDFIEAIAVNVLLRDGIFAIMFGTETVQRLPFRRRLRLPGEPVRDRMPCLRKRASAQRASGGNSGGSGSFR